MEAEDAGEQAVLVLDLVELGHADVRGGPLEPDSLGRRGFLLALQVASAVVLLHCRFQIQCRFQM